MPDSKSIHRAGEPQPWNVVETEFLQDCAVFTVSRVHSEASRSGRRHPFYRIDSTDWVNVIPVTPEGRVVMVRQWRHGERAVTLEIPGGMVDRGEDPAQAAMRELREETGYTCEAVELLGGFNPNPALFGNRTFAYLARGVRATAEIQNDGNEETIVEVVNRDELRRMTREGRVNHSLVITALHLWDLYEEALSP